MAATIATSWSIGEEEGIFTRCTEGELLMVTRGNSLPHTQQHTAARGATAIQLDLVGLDLSRNVALLRPLPSSTDACHEVAVLKSRSVADELKMDVKTLTQLITNVGKIAAKTERTFRYHEPATFEMRADEFASLQKEASNPFGVFSRDNHGNIFEGWSRTGKQLNVAGVWRRLALSLPYSSNFFLRGFEVISYRAKYNQGYTVPRIISLH